MKINTYLMFDGNCEDAIGFYKDVLNGQISTQMRYSDAPEDMPMPDHMMNKIMHTTLEFEGGSIMACDTHDKLNLGNAHHLSLNIASEEEALAVFNSLADGGQIAMPFEEVFWGGKFGMLTDKFGIQWMVSSEHKPA
ncbi:VOC family protein [Poritiphilus flavus]|uniref:VOC family protein n=1 Tax=Poritiphilus flavus TaxID=2697053 RepID=A0A6L9EAH6_9FLAO|nr:VOC family protein [Poritiphilus flavus]NAS11710.1 VOC family protein [Poritiphilus flavus]